MKHNTDNEFDSTLNKKLKAYGEGAPRRNPEAAKHTRDRFMAELEHLNLGASAPNPISSNLRLMFMSWVSGLTQQKENLAMSLRQRSTMTIVSTILVLVVFLFGGGGITAYAASAALPGDALYTVKTGIENARVGFTGNPEVQAGLFLGFAGKRVDEIRALISEGRLSNINETASQFQKEIHKALDAIQKLSDTDPVRAAQLSADAANILKGYSDSLSNLLAAAPKDVQPVIQTALDASQSAEAGNSNANINDDNGNANMNDNDTNINDDQNANGSDDNSNANINDDHNANGSDDNSNSNINDDQNANGSDDNSNASMNDNSNANGSNDNSNANINDNSNANGTDNSGGNNSSGGGKSGGGGSGGGNSNDGGGSGHGGSKP